MDFNKALLLSETSPDIFLNIIKRFEYNNDGILGTGKSRDAVGSSLLENICNSLYKEYSNNGIFYYDKNTQIDKEKTFLYVIIALITLLLCTTVSTGVYKYKYDRFVAEHRQQLELSRARADVLTDTLTRAREEVGAIGESLSRQRTSVADLRELIGEVREKYTKMEELLNSSWDDYGDVGNNDNCDYPAVSE